MLNAVTYHYNESKSVYCLQVTVYDLPWRIDGGGGPHHKTHIAKAEALESHLQKTEDMRHLQHQ
jgi:hypothetical protein